MSSKIRLFVSVIAGLMLAFGASVGTSNADDLEKFYKGKRLKMIVGSGAGGGYDAYSRLVARHIGNFIPGSPTMIVQNMPGAGGIKAANYMENVAPKDGTVVGGMQRSVVLVQLMGQKGPKFKSSELLWLGSLAKEAGVCAMASRTGITRLNQARNTSKVFAMGGSGQNSTEFWPALLRNTMGLNYKLIRGYPSTAQIHLAIAKGELDGICQSWASFKEQANQMLKDKTITPIVQIALHNDKEMTKLGVPLLSDYLSKENIVKGQTVDDVTLFFRLTVIPPLMGRPFAMASGIPTDRGQAVKAAFETMAKDKKFLSDAKRIKKDIELVSGDEIQKIISDLAKTPPEKLAALKDMFKFTGPVEKVVLPIIVEGGKVLKIKRKGRRITIDFKGKKRRANVSGKKTKVFVNGKAVKRNAVKVGMTCNFHYYGHKTTAKKIDCKG